MLDPVMFAFNAQSVLPDAVLRAGPWSVAFFRTEAGESDFTRLVLERLRSAGCLVTVLDAAEEVLALGSSQQRARRREVLMDSFHSVVIDAQGSPAERLCALLAHPDTTLPVAALDPSGRLQDSDLLGKWFGRTLRGAVAQRIWAVSDVDGVVDVVFQDALAEASRYANKCELLAASRIIAQTIGERYWDRFTGEIAASSIVAGKGLAYLIHIRRACGLDRRSGHTAGQVRAVTLSVPAFLFAARAGGLQDLRALTLEVNSMDHWTWEDLTRCHEACVILAQLTDLVVMQQVSTWPVDLSVLPALQHLTLLPHYCFDVDDVPMVRVSKGFPNELKKVSIHRTMAECLPRDVAKRVTVEVLDTDDW